MASVEFSSRCDDVDDVDGVTSVSDQVCMLARCNVLLAGNNDQTEGQNDLEDGRQRLSSSQKPSQSLKS